MSIAERKAKAHPIDVHVGSRVRLARNLIGMSQETLAGGVELTFQQIQKYENGANRISASRLVQFSEILKVPVGFFFEGVPGSGTPEPRSEVTTVLDAMAQDRAVVLLVGAFTKLGPSHRGSLVRLVRVMAGETGVGAEAA